MPLQPGLFSTEVLSYDEQAYITITNATDSQFSFTIDGPTELQENFIVIRFSSDTYKDKNTTNITYDNTYISWVPFDTLLRLQAKSNAEPKWTKVIEEDSRGNQVTYFIIWIPALSVHDISIITFGEIQEIIRETNVMIFYVISLILAAIVSIIHMRFIWKK